jgi:hypothetical protein
MKQFVFPVTTIGLMFYWVEQHLTYAKLLGSTYRLKYSTYRINQLNDHYRQLY